MPKQSTGAGAVIDGRYRYKLWRRWHELDAPTMCFVMLNPSTADATTDDPTIRRCMGFANREGYGGLFVVNLFGLRVTRPVHLWDSGIDPEGPGNYAEALDVVSAHAHQKWPIVCAWGAHRNYWRAKVYNLLYASSSSLPLLCLGTTKDGAPRHPLYLAEKTPLEKWEP